LLGELEGDRGFVICDMEAGLGTVSRVKPGQLDVVLVVAEPTAKGIDVARRAAQVASSRARVIVVANRIAGEADLDVVREALGSREIVPIPEEPVIARADQDGIAPIDADSEAPGVLALRRLADALMAAR
jgi:CO dehydrogenase maturation factor